ncbi:MAG: DUF2085 domain-containing protein [Chloroflexota bacterium]
MIDVTLYTRQGCHLCETAKTDLEALRPVFPHRLVEVDIDSDPALVQQYGVEVPVVVSGPFTLKAPFTRQELQVTLSAAIDRARHILMVENSPLLEQVRTQAAWTRSDQFDLWLSNHYMSFLNILVAIYLGLAFLAPVLVRAGYTTPGNLLYKTYGFVCHQLSYRSFFLFGEQIVYPRQAAGLEELESFSQVTGLGESGSVDDVFAARSFVGDEHVGYKVALCERDVAIYGSILLFGLLFSATGRRLKSIPWWLWLALAIVPIGLDGFSQLFSQPPLNFIPYRESTPALRVLTGSLFGLMTAWFGYPMVEESMADTRKYKTEKLRRLQGR